MNTSPNKQETAEKASWPPQIYACLKEARVRLISYVPDAGHSHVIRCAHDDPDMDAIVLTTEEEGVAISAGAWLGGNRSVLLTQSSGVGNCINSLSLVNVCRFPFLTLVTMRGEWAEFNPWQVPMGRATAKVLEAMGVTVLRLERPTETREVISAAATLAFESDQQVAVLISQRMVGPKQWKEGSR